MAEQLKNAEQTKKVAQIEAPELSEEVKKEIAELTKTQRAAVLLLLLGEEQAANIIKYLNPKEVQSLGAAMVAVQDLSQEAVNVVLDDFIALFKKQTSLGFGVDDYVETVLKKALGEDKAASVLRRILPSSASKGLDFILDGCKINCRDD